MNPLNPLKMLQNPTHPDLMNIYNEAGQLVGTGKLVMLSSIVERPGHVMTVALEIVTRTGD